MENEKCPQCGNDTHSDSRFCGNCGAALNQTENSVSNDPKETAKELYFQYACSNFHMDHDGVLVEYQKYNISKSEELEWRREYISHWISQLSVDDMQALRRLENASAYEALPHFYRMAEKGDGFSKLHYANAIWNLRNGVSPEEYEKATATSVSLWESLVQKRISLTGQHRKICDASKEHLGATTPEDYVVNYAKRKLAEARHL